MCSEACQFGGGSATRAAHQTFALGRITAQKFAHVNACRDISTWWFLMPLWGRHTRYKMDLYGFG